MLPFAVKAHILSIGTESLLGESLDSNTEYIAFRLPALGVDPYYTSDVGDNLGRLLGHGRAGSWLDRCWAVRTTSTTAWLVDLREDIWNIGTPHVIRQARPAMD